MEWIIENIGLLTNEILIPVIGAIITSLIKPLVDKSSKYEINYSFFVNLVFGIVIAASLDYKININGDIRLSIKIYTISIVCTFILIVVLNVLFDFIFRRIKVIIKVHQLTIDECEYVIKCRETKQYLKVEFNTYPEFTHQWDGILYLKYGRMIAINEEYRIFVNSYALKKVKQKLAAVKTNETKI